MPAGRLDEKIEAFLKLGDRGRALRADVRTERHAPEALLSAALLHDPRVVVFDEPNSGLDVTASLVLRSFVKALAREGKLILYSSHLLETVEAVCTNVVILHEGRSSPTTTRRSCAT